MYPVIIIGTVRSLWTWLWGRYHVPQNVFLVQKYFSITGVITSLLRMEYFLLLLLSVQDEVTLQFCASKLDKKDLFGKSDPFLLFSRTNENGS